MQILITGASGLLGINLALELSRQHTVFGVINRRSLRTDAFTVLEADLLAPGVPERVIDQTQPDWVIHCAALADVDVCETEPELARRLNTGLPKILAGYVARGGARLIHVSTDAVFDGWRGDYGEEDEPSPVGVYARTKLAGERAVQEANPEAIIARVNLIAWGLGGKRSLAEFFYYNLREGKPVMGFTDVIFCPLLANHMAGIFSQMLEKRLNGLYHVVAGEGISKYAFGQQLARRFELDETLIAPTLVAHGGLRAARSPRLTLRTDKLANALGTALPNISTAIEGFYTLYQQGYPQKLSVISNQ